MINRETPTSGNNMVFFRLITLFQLTGMVLSYNFSSCNHYQMLSSENNNLFCETKSDCLTVIEQLAHNWSNNCSSEMGETVEDFVNRTRIALKNYCPVFQGNQTNHMQTPQENIEERIKKMTCSEIARNLLEIWREYWRETEKSTRRGGKRREDRV
ncbi:thymic stromal lymphopoietin isoform X2 [Notamacropus eugenii]|uniref:thymic stromal lymphopoietin isoform X2 n=1 Tax=Notamacropus eugenii TaxID=9315 RepID=UPI003B6750D0